MATSSITKNFPIKVNATFLTDPKDIAKFMEKRKKTSAGNKFAKEQSVEFAKKQQSVNRMS